MGAKLFGTVKGRRKGVFREQLCSFIVDEDMAFLMLFDLGIRKVYCQTFHGIMVSVLPNGELSLWDSGIAGISQLSWDSSLCETHGTQGVKEKPSKDKLCMCLFCGSLWSPGFY